MAWGYEASFTIEHINNGNKRLRCYDCFYFEESDKSCSKTPRYLPDDGYDSWKYCGEFEINPSVSFKDEKLRQYNNWIRNKTPKTYTRYSRKSTSSTYVEEKPKIPNSYISRYSTANSKANEVAKRGTVTNGVPLLSREERETLPLVECGFFKIIPRPREKKLLGIKLEDGTLAQVNVFVSGDCIYYKKSKYPREYISGVRAAIKNKDS